MPFFMVCVLESLQLFIWRAGRCCLPSEPRWPRSPYTLERHGKAPQAARCLCLPRALFLLFKRSNMVGEQYLLLTVVAQFFPASLTAGATIAGSGGQYHTCAVQSAGSLMCWGSNAYGQLGTGDTVDRLTPTAVSVGVGTPARRPTCSFQSAILSRL